MGSQPFLVHPEPPPPLLAQTLDLAGFAWKAVSNAAVATADEPEGGWLGAIVCAEEDPEAAFSLCRSLRRGERHTVPVLLLVSGAQLGDLEHRDDMFDDFCLSPFHPRELEARVRHLTFRTGSRTNPELGEYGELVLNFETYQAMVEGKPLDLTYMEYELLKFFVTHPGKVFTREQLLFAVWGYEYYGGARTVDVHVRRLRAKLGEEHANLIQTVRSVGYRFGQTRSGRRRVSDRLASRRLAAALEPCIGQVYFAPEAHSAYESLGFSASPGVVNGVAMPDGPAYFTSRGSLMGQVAPHVVAAAFGVFNPDAVVPSVQYGWSLTDAPTIFAARRAAGVAQLRRVLGDTPSGIARVNKLLDRAVAPLRPEGRALFSGLCTHWDAPSDPLTHFFHRGDQLREYRGDSHIAAWISAGVDATEIGLLTELYIGLPLRTYARTRAWTDAQFDAAMARLAERGWVTDDAFTDSGRAAREAIEVATDVQSAPIVEALGDDLDEVVATITPWGDAVRAAGGYIGGAGDLWPNRG